MEKFITQMARCTHMHHDNDNGELTFASVCSGIEAASVAFTPLGWRAVCFSEIEKFPSAVLAHHYPNVPNLGDFTKIDTRALPRVDILCGGTPCQAFSVAGLRQSLDDARGNLSLEFVRLAHELADGNGLRNVVWENVPGVLSTKDNAFGCFLAGLVGATDALPPPAGRRWPNAGMVAGPKGRAAWRILDAQFFGLAQRRKRVIVVADFGNGADPAAVLFEPESVRRDSPPSRETGQGVAPTISARTKGGGGLGTDFDLDGGLRVVSRPLLAKGNDSFDETLQTYVPSIARCVATREGSSQDYESTTMVAVGVTGPISHALKAEGADASEDGTGGGTPIVCVHGTQDPCSSPHTAFAFQTSQSGVRIGDVHATLDSNNGPRRHNGAVYGSAVRRLTPRECERLQGFPDDYTRIPWRGKLAEECPDGPRYKALGNSWAVPLFAWLGRRITNLMPPIAANDNNTAEDTHAAA
jgi:DNA (cytosine-5)-methyltransferase 1